MKKRGFIPKPHAVLSFVKGHWGMVLQLKHNLRMITNPCWHRWIRDKPNTVHNEYIVIS